MRLTCQSCVAEFASMSVANVINMIHVTFATIIEAKRDERDVRGSYFDELPMVVATWRIIKIIIILQR